jgi:hypothetical protein
MYIYMYIYAYDIYIYIYIYICIILAAEEIFCYYGDENGEADWFSQRGIVMHNQITLDVSLRLK